MEKILLAAVLLAFLPPGVMAEPGEEIVSLKYLQMQKGASVSCSWDKGEIRIKKAGVEAKLLLNCPYIICGDSIVRVDTPPFTEGGNIYIGGYTYEAISGILDSGGVNKARVNATAAAVRATATPDNEPPPVLVEKPAAIKTAKLSPVAKKTVPPARVKTPTPAVVVEEKPPQKRARKYIVLDPGHGGNDPGAIGPNNLKEKDAVLAIALRVKDYLRSQPVEVFITRSSDKYISLKDRAVFANKKDADLFVSIHCNASPSRAVRGTRTYIYSRVASSKEAAAAAKFENKAAGMFAFLLNDLRKNADEYLSIEAAGNIQHCLVKSLGLRWSPTARAPFYVLANTNMPSVLVETAFISNYSEAKKLKDDGFRDKVAKGIADGIGEYLKKIK